MYRYGEKGKRLPKKYRPKKENSKKLVQEAIEWKKKYGYAYLVIEKCTQIVSMYEALWKCQMAVNQSIAVHQLPYDYYEVKDVDDFLNKTGKDYA